MKHLMTLMALVVAVTAGAQGTTIHEYPWNPDSNNDNLIGINDLLDFLPVFGDEFGLPPEPCDYDGTPLENWIQEISDGVIILDSVFIEFQLFDVVDYYVFGCPDPISDTLLLDNYGMLTEFNGPYSGGWWIVGPDAYNGTMGNSILDFRILFDSSTGGYELRMEQNYLQQAGYEFDGFFGGNVNAKIPFTWPVPSDWSIDENGIHLSGWQSNDWPYYANYLHILPYWHYAE